MVFCCCCCCCCFKVESQLRASAVAFHSLISSSFCLNSSDCSCACFPSHIFFLLFTGEEEFGVFLQPVPFCEGDGFLLIGFLDSGILRGYGFLDCGDFFFCQDVDAFQLPVLVFVFRPSFLGGGIYFGTYFGVDTCTGQLFQNIRFFRFPCFAGTW